MEDINKYNPANQAIDRVGNVLENGNKNKNGVVGVIFAGVCTVAAIAIKALK